MGNKQPKLQRESELGTFLFRRDKRRLYEMRMKIFRRIPQPTLPLYLVAVILLMAVVACGSGALSATATPAQSLDVAQQSTEPTTAQPSKDTAGERSDEPALQEPTVVPAAISAGDQGVSGEVGDQAPEFQRVANWINSPPLTMEALRGQVVLIDFWTYTCVNCIRTFPYLKEWYAKYADKGLKIVGVHTPEFEFEKVTENVVRSAGEYGLGWPIAQDNDFGTWRAYSNRFWPAKYLVDQHGIVRYTHFGEGAYSETEEQIRRLLEEAGADLPPIHRTSA